MDWSRFGVLILIFGLVGFPDLSEGRLAVGEATWILVTFEKGQYRVQMAF
jgi:hypothetical protein